MKEKASERFARELLERTGPARLRRIPESDVRTPDYELQLDGSRVAVAEVKTLSYAPRTEANGFKITTHEHGDWYERSDNSPARVGRCIYDAWKQLSGHSLPKILIFVNEEIGMDVLDLQEAVEGFLIYGTKETGYFKNVRSRRIAEGDIKAIRWQIDLYVWIERSRRSRFKVATGELVPPPPEVVFRPTNKAGLDIARRCFGCTDPCIRPNAPGRENCDDPKTT